MAGSAARLYVEIEANVSDAIAGMKATDAQLKKTAATAKATAASTATSTRKASVGYTMLGTSAGGATKEVEKSAAATAKASRAAQRVTSDSRVASSAMAGFGASSTLAQGGAIALAYGLTKTIQTTAAFDGAMRNVNSIAGLSEGQFKKLSLSVQHMATDTAQAPQTLAEGLYQIVSSGFKAQAGMNILRSSARAATAGLTDTATATTAVVGVLNAYHLKARDAAKVSDDLFQTVNLGVLSFQDLAQGIGPVLPFASKLGVSLKQVGAMTATLTKGGVPAAEAFTYMKGAMAQLVKPTKELQGQFKELGVSSGHELIRKTGSLQAALQALYKSVDGNQEAFAALFPDIRGMTAAFAATGKGAKGAAADLRNFNSTAGATNKVFAEQKKGTPLKWQQLKADVSSAAITFGHELTPAVNTSLTAMDKLAVGAGKSAHAVKTGLKILGTSMLGPIGAAKATYDGAKHAAAGIGKLTGPKVKIGADIGDVESAVHETRGLLTRVSSAKAKPKIVVGTNSRAMALAAQRDINSVHGKTVMIEVVSKKTGYAGNLAPHAMGGRVSSSEGMSLVGEQGPELVNLPGGSRVHTAAATRHLLADGIDSFAAGGKKKGHHKLTHKQRLALRKKRKRLANKRREGKRRLGEELLGAELAGAELDDATDPDTGDPINRANNTTVLNKRIAANQKRAARLETLSKKKGLTAGRRADYLAALADVRRQIKSDQDEIAGFSGDGAKQLAETMKALADALEATKEELKRQNNIAESNKGITKATLRSALADLTNNDLGGIFGQRFQTTSRRTSAYVAR